MTTSLISEQVEAEFSCHHPNVEMRRRRVSNGVEHVYRQCVNCGKSFGAVGSRDLVPGLVRDLAHFDEELRESLSARRSARWQELAGQARTQRSEEWWAHYHAYLETPQWKRKRAKVLQRDRGICQSCLEAVAVQAHHTTYDHLGDEPLFELQAICLPCHERLHGRSLGQ